MAQLWLTEDQEVQVYGKALADNFRGDCLSHVIYFLKKIDGRIIKFTCKTKNPTLASRYASTELKKRIKNPDEEKKYKLLITDAIVNFLKEKYKSVESEELD